VSFLLSSHPAIYTLSLHDALPIYAGGSRLTLDLVPFARSVAGTVISRQEVCVMNRLELAGQETIELQPFERGKIALLAAPVAVRSEEHTSELQSRSDLVCRLLLEK